MAPPRPNRHDSHDVSAQNRLCHAAGDTAVNVTEWFIPGMRRFPYFGWQIRSGKNNGSVFCRAHSYVGAARTMKLLKTVFWLGVVIYYLPSSASQSGAPASVQGSATK